MYRYTKAHDDHFRHSGLKRHHGPFTIKRKLADGILVLVDIDGDEFQLHESWVEKIR